MGKNTLKLKDNAPTSEKLAEIFQTNPTYIKQAKRIKQEQPEEFEKVKTRPKLISRASSLY